MFILDLLRRYRRTDRDRRTLETACALRRFYFQHRGIGSGKAGRRFVKSNQRRHFQRQTLFEVGGVQLRLLDDNRSVLWWCDETDRRQGSTRAVREHIGKNRDADDLARLAFDILLD